MIIVYVMRHAGRVENIVVVQCAHLLYQTNLIKKYSVAGALLLPFLFGSQTNKKQNYSIHASNKNKTNKNNV